MSLTKQLEDRKSPVGAFMRERFPFKKVQGVLGEVHEALGGDRMASNGDTPSWALGLIGHAVDYRIRYHFRHLGADELALAMEGAWNVTAGADPPETEIVGAGTIPEAVIGALKEEPRGTVDHGGYRYRRRRGRIERTALGHTIAYLNFAQPQFEKYLPTDCTADFFDWLADETKEIGAHRREPSLDEEWALAEYCLVLGVFESQWRTNWRRWPPPMFGTALPSSVEELVDSIPDAWVLDAAAMGVRFQARHAGWRGATAELNPGFSGSGDVGGADADLIVDGCLWEIKCTARTKGQSDWLHQLLAYVLLDYEDEYGIEQAGFLLPRQDKALQWPVGELIERTCSPSFLPVAELRAMLRQRLKDVAERART